MHHVGILYDQFMMHGQRNIKYYKEYSCVCDDIHMYHLACSCYSTTQRGWHTSKLVHQTWCFCYNWTEVSVQQLKTLVWLANVWPHDLSILYQINCDSLRGSYEALEPICNSIVSNCKRLWYHCENVVSHLCTSVIWLAEKRLFHYLIAKVGFLFVLFCHMCV